MDVRRNAFPHRLLEVLEAIADAHFVAIDLEYSGIASRGTTGARIVQTVQQRYDEVRQAADQFQVLQLGLTCAYEDPARGVYSLRPYNFDVCPLLLDRRLGLDRHFTFQSSALDFLLSHGFDVAAPFTTGVPYLSRAESLRAAQLADVRAEPDGGIEDIELGSDDVQARQFVSKVKSDIAGWLESKSKVNYITAGRPPPCPGEAVYLLGLRLPAVPVIPLLSAIVQ